MLTKIEIDDCLQRLSGGAVAQRLGQHVQPGGIFGHDEDRDSNVVEVLLGRLRRKLDPDGNLAPIETLRGRGLRFTLG